jgi:hypothetical protein
MSQYWTEELPYPNSVVSKVIKSRFKEINLCSNLLSIIFKEEVRVRVRLGAPKPDKTSQNSVNIEEFLTGLRFEQRGRLEELNT